MNLEYTLSSSNPENHLLDISLKIENNNSLPKLLNVSLSAWRPGRYELGFFSKYIQKLTVVNTEGYPLPFKKVSKEEWEIETKENDTIFINYTYYASILNAGSTYIDQEQLYVNPVNSLLKVNGFENCKARIVNNFMQGVVIAGSLPLIEDNIMESSNFDELADSPFIISKTIKHDVFVVKGVSINIWFQGEVKPNWKKLQQDFTKFIEAQIDAYGEFVSNEYHFLIQITPYPSYHGVEHLNSTVLLLGPSYEIFEKRYVDLLGVSSHEFYHSWNIKSIRPVEMYPYDFSKENYFTTGYVAEGVTTYMGDQYLYRSNVFTDEQYIFEFDAYLKKHFDNFGRRNYSVAQSSFDMWLDGYQLGVPNRKVSIYTEGALAAFMLDVLILKYSNLKHTLDDVMNDLYHNFAKKDKGYSDEDYKTLAEKYSGVELDDFFDNFIFGTEPFNNLLLECLNFIGFELHENDSEQLHEQYGFKGIWKESYFEISAIAPESNAESSGFAVGDKIHVINGMKLQNNLEQWMNYFKQEDKQFSVERISGIVEKTIVGKPFNGYRKYTIAKNKSLSELQTEAFKRWMRS